MTATANTAPAVSDSASASISLDDAANLNFADPEEEQDNGATWRPNVDEQKDDSATLDKVAESMPDDENEGEEPTAEEAGANEADDKPEENADPDAAPILLKGGEQVTLGELKLGYMRDKDYRNKTHALGASRRSLEDKAARVIKAVDAVAGFLASQLPEEPDLNLALSNPDEYTRRTAMFNAGLQRINAVLALANEPKTAEAEVKKEATEEELAQQNALLIQAFPELAQDEVRNKFFADTFKTAQEFGFTPEEMAEHTDHRYYKVMHWAMKGLEAAQAEQQAARAKQVAMQKVNNAPPIVAKAKPATTPGKSAGNREAMKKLRSSGSLRDAMNVDF